MNPPKSDFDLLYPADAIKVAWKNGRNAGLKEALDLCLAEKLKWEQLHQQALQLPPDYLTAQATESRHLEAWQLASHIESLMAMKEQDD